VNPLTQTYSSNFIISPFYNLKLEMAHFSFKMNKNYGIDHRIQQFFDEFIMKSKSPKHFESSMKIDA